MKRIYWQNLEAESCGWVESDQAAEILELNPDFEVYVPKQTYDLRVLEGFNLHAPVTSLLLSEEDRENMFRRLDRLAQQVLNMRGYYQNAGVSMDDEVLNSMRHSRESIHKSLTSIIRETANKVKEVK